MSVRAANPSPAGRDSWEDDLRTASFSKFDVDILKRLSPFIRPYRLTGYAAIGAILAFVATQLAVPSLIRAGVDTIVGKAGSHPLLAITALFVALIGLNAVTSYLSDVTAARLAQRVIFDLRRAMFEHLQQMSMSFIDRAHVGGLMSRLQGDVNALQDFFETSISAVGDVALLVGIIVVLLAMEWRLALITLIILPVLAVIRSIWLPRAMRAFSHARETSSIVNGALAENIAGIRVVQGTRREQVNLSAYTAKVDMNLKAQAVASWSGQVMVPTVDILTGASMATIVLGGGWLIAHGHMDLGAMVAFIFYVQRFFDPIRTLSQQYTTMQRAMAAAHRIFEVLELPVAVSDAPDAVDVGRLDSSIEFRNVAFGYRPNQPVLRNLSLKIEPRQTIALVGPTGSGKSSIASLIRRFYDVQQGQVLVGGYDVRALTLKALSRNIAMVLQEPFLFTGTVLDNILYSTPSAGRQEAIKAARAVHAHDFIAALPQGYDTQLDQRGQNLSIGERQLLSFARALVADPQILILDEATASIDSFVEAQIQDALRVLMAGRTSIIIAHRLATVKDADRVIVLRDGEILEQGAPADLLAAGGLYASLHRHNFSSFDELNIT